MLQIALAENKRLTEENASLRRDIAGLRRDLRQVGDAASAITSVALCLVRMALDRGDAVKPGQIRISKQLHDRMVGASIRLGRGPDESITVQLRDEGKERVVADT